MFQRVLRDAKDRDVNESDTVTIITDMLASVFGFDKYADVTSEQAIRGTFCDLAVKMDGKIKFLIEVKAIGLDLKENHLRQAVNYGANHGTDWVVLTNGVEWQIHKIKFERPVDAEQVCSFNFLELRAKASEDQSKLFLLCKEGIQKAAIEEFHAHTQTVNRFVIAAILNSAPVLSVIRREIRRLSPEVQVSTDQIQTILTKEVLKREVVEAEAASRAGTRVKKASSRQLRQRKTKAKSAEGEAPKNDDSGAESTES